MDTVVNEWCSLHTCISSRPVSMTFYAMTQIEVNKYLPSKLFCDSLCQWSIQHSTNVVPPIFGWQICCLHGLGCVILSYLYDTTYNSECAAVSVCC